MCDNSLWDSSCDSRDSRDSLSSYDSGKFQVFSKDDSKNGVMDLVPDTKKQTTSMLSNLGYLEMVNVKMLKEWDIMMMDTYTWSSYEFMVIKNKDGKISVSWAKVGTNVFYTWEYVGTEMNVWGNFQVSWDMPMIEDMTTSIMDKLYMF